MISLLPCSENSCDNIELCLHVHDCKHTYEWLRFNKILFNYDARKAVLLWPFCRMIINYHVVIRRGNVCCEKWINSCATYSAFHWKTVTMRIMLQMNNKSSKEYYAIKVTPADFAEKEKLNKSLRILNSRHFFHFPSNLYVIFSGI